MSALHFGARRWSDPGLTPPGVPPNWRDSAACASVDPELFYPPEAAGAATARKAKQVCGRCPVRNACLLASVDERWGIWAGLTEMERRNNRGARREATA